MILTFSCCDFYWLIKSNKDFFKKILSAEKYDWANVYIFKCLRSVLFLSSGIAWGCLGDPRSTFWGPVLLIKNLFLKRV